MTASAETGSDIVMPLLANDSLNEGGSLSAAPTASSKLLPQKHARKQTGTRATRLSSPHVGRHIGRYHQTTATTTMVVVVQVASYVRVRACVPVCMRASV